MPRKRRKRKHVPTKPHGLPGGPHPLNMIGGITHDTYKRTHGMDGIKHGDASGYSWRGGGQ